MNSVEQIQSLWKRIPPIVHYTTTVRLYSHLLVIILWNVRTLICSIPLDYSVSISQKSSAIRQKKNHRPHVRILYQQIKLQTKV